VGWLHVTMNGRPRPARIHRVPGRDPLHSMCLSGRAFRGERAPLCEPPAVLGALTLVIARIPPLAQVAMRLEVSGWPVRTT
jgi:hypothetical protein